MKKSRSRVPVLKFEELEPRYLMDASADVALAGGVLNFEGGKNLAMPGAPGTVVCYLNTTAGAGLHGAVSLYVYASADGSLDDGVLIGSLENFGISLSSGTSQMAPNVPVNLPANLAAGAYTVFVKLVPGQGLADGNIANDLAQIGAPLQVAGTSPAADLVAYLDHTTFDGLDTVSPGATGAATVVLANLFDQPVSGNVTISVYLTGGGSDDVLIGSAQQNAGGLSYTGGPVQVNVPLHLPRNAGSYQYVVKIDSSADGDTTDNSATGGAIDIEQTFIDLTSDIDEDATSLPDVILAGSSGVVTVDLANYGNVTASGPMTVNVYASTTGDVDGTAILLGSVSGNYVVDTDAGATVDVPVKFPGSLAGSDDGYYLVTQVASPLQDGDPEDGIGGGDSLDVEAPFIDLCAGLDGSGLPAALVPGHSDNVTVDLTNWGNCTADGNIKVSIYASASGDLDGSQILLGSVSGRFVVDLEDGAVVKVPIKVPSSFAIDDSYTIICKATSGMQQGDPADGIDYSSPIYVEEPDVELASGIDPANLPGAILPGLSDTIAVDLTNDGNCLANGKMTVSVYASASGELDGSQTLLGSVSGTFAVSTQDGATVSVPVKYPAGIDAGQTYFLVTQVTSSLQSDDASDGTGVSDWALPVEQPRIDLTSAIDFYSGTLSDEPVQGDSGVVAVDLGNLGNQTASGAMTINVYASASGDLDGGQILLGTVSRNYTVDTCDGAVANVPVTLPADMPEGYYCLVSEVTSPLQQGDASDGVGSTDGAIYVEAKGTDLYASVNDPSFSGDVLAGSIGRTTVAIDNYGNAAADGTVTITLFLDDGHDGMTPLTTVAQQVNLAPDQELAVPMAFVLPAGLKAGEYQLVAEVNPPDSFNDACDDNIGTSDWFDVTGPGSDLSVSVGQITVTGAGQDSGSQPGGTSLENSNGGSFDGAGLPAGGAGAVSITSGGVMLLGGGPTVSNCLAYNLGDSCISPSIYRVSFPRTMAPPSGSVSLTVGNQGGGVQGNVIVSLYASTDGSFDGATPIADQSVYVSLGDGEQQSLNVNFFMPGTLADGDYYLLAKVSAPAVFGDTNADNNAAASGSTFAFTQPPADSSGSTYYWPNYSYLLSAYSNGYSCYALCDLVATSTVSGGGQGNVKSLVGGSSQHSASSQHGGDSQPRHYTGGGSTSAIDSLPTPASQAPVSDLLAVAADAPSVLATAPRLVNLDANLAIVGPVGQAPAQGAAMPAGGTFGYYEKPSAGQSPWGSSTHLKKLLSPILTGDGLDDATLSTPLIQVV